MIAQTLIFVIVGMITLQSPGPIESEDSVFRLLAPSEPQTLHFELKIYTETGYGLEQIQLKIAPSGPINCPECDSCSLPYSESRCVAVAGDEIHLCNIGPPGDPGYVDYLFTFPTSNVWWVIEPRVPGEQIMMEAWADECVGTAHYSSGWIDRFAGGLAFIPGKRCYRIHNGHVQNIEDVVYVQE